MRNTVIIGGGPAGLMAAISSAKNGDKVTIIEKMNSCGKKLLITGKGRCNITNNAQMDKFMENTPTNPKFLYGVFNIKRELRSVEVLKLKQDIYETENEIKNPANNVNQLKPKLIYMYFWLVDHYIQKNQTGSEVSDLLLKIKILDRNVYDLYIK